MLEALLLGIMIGFAPSLFETDTAADIKKDAESSVYRLEGLDGTGQGTGFVALTMKGKKVIVTNWHVCMGNKAFNLYSISGKIYKNAKVLKEDKASDLCLVQAPKSAPALELADDVHVNDTIYSLGYPQSKLQHIDDGLIVGITKDEMQFPIELKNCKAEKYKIKVLPIRTQIGIIPQSVCIYLTPRLMTTVQAAPGASGSPYLNEDGKVVGVLNLISDYTGWSQGIPLGYLKTFLNKY